MSIDPKDNDLIERFLLGKLNEAETRAFNERVGRDREFARKLRLITMFPEMLSGEGKKEYDQKVAQSGKKPVGIKRHNPLKSKYFIWIVVPLVVITGVVLIFLFRTTTPVQSQKEFVKPAATDTILVPAVKAAVKKTVPPAPSMTEPVRVGIELVRPLEGATFSRSDEIVFQWIQHTDTFTKLYIYSISNDKLMLWRGIRPGIREYRFPATKFPPGTFYWFVGKNNMRQTFTIKP